MQYKGPRKYQWKICPIIVQWLSLKENLLPNSIA